MQKEYFFNHNITSYILYDAIVINRDHFTNQDTRYDMNILNLNHNLIGWKPYFYSEFITMQYE